jgi:hypothetical protein
MPEKEKYLNSGKRVRGWKKPNLLKNLEQGALVSGEQQPEGNVQKKLRVGCLIKIREAKDNREKIRWKALRSKGANVGLQLRGGPKSSKNKNRCLICGGHVVKEFYLK